jgi:hypothetical protein
MMSASSLLFGSRGCLFRFDLSGSNEIRSSYRTDSYDRVMVSIRFRPPCVIAGTTEFFGFVYLSALHALLKNPAVFVAKPRSAPTKVCDE